MTILGCFGGTTTLGNTQIEMDVLSEIPPWSLPNRYKTKMILERKYILQGPSRLVAICQFFVGGKGVYTKEEIEPTLWNFRIICQLHWMVSCVSWRKMLFRNHEGSWNKSGWCIDQLWWFWNFSTNIFNPLKTNISPEHWVLEEEMPYLKWSRL